MTIDAPLRELLTVLGVERIEWKGQKLTFYVDIPERDMTRVVSRAGVFGVVEALRECECEARYLMMMLMEEK